MLKYIIFIWMAMLTSVGFAQIVNTVCIGSIHNYKVDGDVGSVYKWHINGGTIISDPIQDSIIVKWGNTGGICQIYVIETSIHGCIGDTVFSQVIVNPLNHVTVNGPNEICIGESITLTAINATSTIWSNGSTNQSITVYPTLSSTYNLIGTTICSIDTISHFITVHPNPQADFISSNNSPVVGENINLIYTGTPVVSYSWFDFNNLFSSQFNPNYTIENKTSTNFSLFVKNQFGCMDSISKTIITLGSVNVWIPNSFTPNGDGLNDVFKAEAETEVKDFSFYIYNRWGQLVFESKNINIGWDGRFNGEAAQQGVYTWVLTYNSDNNRNIASRKTGQVTLLL